MAKGAETDTKSALSEIKATSGTLTRITNRHLDRLSGIIDRAVTRDTNLESAATKLQGIAGTNDGLLERGNPHLPPEAGQGDSNIRNHQIPGMPDPLSVEQLREEYLTMAFALYFYTAHANFAAGSCLPPVEQYDPTNAYHELMKNLMDNSMHDFTVIANVLSKIAEAHPDWLSEHRLYQMGEKAREIRGLVKTSTQMFETQAALPNNA
jgi:hypothetical protein